MRVTTRSTCGGDVSYFDRISDELEQAWPSGEISYADACAEFNELEAE